MTHDVERVLADIDADHGDRCVEFLRHGVLLVLSAPCQLLILAGPEHGRTIPLTEVAGLSQRPSGCAADLISCAASAGPYSYSDALGHIDALHAQQLNQTIIV